MSQPHSLIIDGHIDNSTGSVAYLLARVFNRRGWKVVGQPIARTYQGQRIVDFCLTFSDQKVFSRQQTVDILLCFSQSCLEHHAEHLTPDSLVISDSHQVDVSRLSKSTQLVSLPFGHLARQAGKHPNMSASVAMGSIMAVLDLPLSGLASIVTESISSQKQEQLAQAAIQSGYQAALAQSMQVANLPKTTTKAAGYIFTGQQALGLAAIAGGVQIITGSQQVNDSTTLLPLLKEVSGAIELTSDDAQTAANQAIGAAMAGSRSATIITAEDIHLIADSYTLAARTETPLVIICQQSDKNSLIPDQQELRSILNAGSNEGPRIILAPANSEECYALFAEALFLAEQHQAPVILLVDWPTIAGFNTCDDLSKIRIPTITTESRLSKQLSQKKTVSLRNNTFNDKSVLSQQNKIKHITKQSLPYKLHGTADAEVSLICYGSTTPLAIQAAEQLKQLNIKANVLQLIHLAPFPSEQINQLCRMTSHLVCLEASIAAQLSPLIRQQAGLHIEHQTLSGQDEMSSQLIVESIQQHFMY